jgi:MoxR-like ATPase
MSNPIQQLRTDLSSRFPERKAVIDGALAAILAGEHILLLGPPGTAKSALARAIAQAFSGNYFERLLTKFSTPEELFGPISLKALEQDKFARVITGKLPGSEFAFIDEIFKANSAILNSLLTLVNERVFHNDGAPMKVPLVTMFGASNELPEGKDLEAVLTTALTMADLRKAQKETTATKITDATVDAVIAIREACAAEGIIASDRRWKKSLKLLQAAAFMAGAKETSPEDASLLVDSLWREPRERPKVARIVGKLADPTSAQAAEILDAAKETATKAAALKSGDRKQYIAQCASALETFTQQRERLLKLSKSAGRRAKEVIADATADIDAMHAELARTVSTGLGLRAAR